jgi:hypothetical protein
MAFTSLGWTKLTSSASSISVNVPSGYEDIVVKFAIRGDRASEDYLIMRVNGSSSTSYSWGVIYSDGSAQAVSGAEGSALNSDTSFRVGWTAPSGTDVNNYTTGIVTAFAYSNASFTKAFRWQSAYENNVTSGTTKSGHGGGYFNSTSTITSLSFHPVYGSNLVAGSTIAVYGYTKA